jgi:hypothetical protein
MLTAIVVLIQYADLVSYDVGFKIFNLYESLLRTYQL